MHAITVGDFLQVTDWAGLGCEQRLGEVRWLDIGGDSISIQVREERWLPVETLLATGAMILGGYPHCHCRDQSTGEWLPTSLKIRLENMLLAQRTKQPHGGA